MPNFYSRLNLESSIFPFYTEAAGRSIMVPGLDENFDRYNAANTAKDKGVPQVFYMHNTVPVAGGFQSIGYIPTLPPVPGETSFDNAFALFNDDGSSYIFSPAAGKNWIFDGNIGEWRSHPFPDGAVNSGTLVTVAYLNGQSYIFYSGYGCFKYTNTTVSFDSVTLTGLVIPAIHGICAANGYLICWTNDTVFWSSLTQPTDFIPSIQTGSGSSAIQDARGPINFVLPLVGGMLVYCRSNVVGASFSGNTAYPYVFLEVKGSGGVDMLGKIAYQSTLPYHIAMTSGGIQQIDLDNAIPTLPEVSDFLTAQYFEDFDEDTLSFSTERLTNQLFMKFAAVSVRYIVISYGVVQGKYTHSIVYDIALNRYGKYKLNHSCCFTYNNPSPSGAITYENMMSTPIRTISPGATYKDFFHQAQYPIIGKKDFAFLQEDGTVQLVDFAISEANASGVFIIGKFQLSRAAVIVHQTTDVETITKDNNFSLHLLGTFNGKDFGPAIPTMQTLREDSVVVCAKRYTAKNISLCLVGAYNLTTMVLLFTIGGFR